MCDRSVGTGWVSAHLYFHGDLDDVIAHVVTPAVRAVAERPAGGQHFFLRYWEGGPHVRLRIRAADQDTAAVQHAIRRHAEDYFARNASATRVDAEAYRATRRWAMSLEPWTDPAAELSPNNSVRFVPYRREHHKYGYGPAMAAVERHFTESSDIARDAVGARMPAAERDLLALCALVAGWSICWPDTEALRAWIRAGGPRFGPTGSAAADGYGAWPAARRDALRALVRHTVDTAGDPTAETPSDPTLRRRWTRSVTTLYGRLGRPVAPGAGRSTVIDNCGHLLCNRLGLSLRREAAVRSLACRAILDPADRR
jgi:thiopeptide-type bacteriocin biosynthesis protein